MSQKEYREFLEEEFPDLLPAFNSKYGDDDAWYQWLDTMWEATNQEEGHLQGWTFSGTLLAFFLPYLPNHASAK